MLLSNLNLYIKRSGKVNFILVFYVDNLTITENDKCVINEVKQDLEEKGEHFHLASNVCKTVV